MQDLVVEVNSCLELRGTGQAAIGWLSRTRLPRLQATSEVLGLALQDRLAADEVRRLAAATVGGVLRILQDSSWCEVLA